MPIRISKSSPLTPTIIVRRALCHPLTHIYHVRWYGSASHSASLNADIEALPASCMRLNNATQQIFGNTVRPVVHVWETNDCTNRWSAQAKCEFHWHSAYKPHTNLRFCTVIDRSRNDRVFLVGQGSATTKQKAKDAAVESGFEYLRSQYPSVDLSGI